MASLAEPTIGGDRNPAYKYPRDVVPDPGIPDGWKATEQVYGEKTKTPGKVYTRYSALDGSIKHVCSAKQVIVLHCERHGGDPDAMLAEYLRLQKDPPPGSRKFMMLQNEKLEKEQREKERIAKGKLEGEMREAVIARFRETFGQLTGPQVCNFENWRTRFDYQPDCDQIRVIYTDPDGGEWALLKDLECSFQTRLERGESGPGGADIKSLIEHAKEGVDKDRFAEAKLEARANQGSVEITASGDARQMTREERIQSVNEEREKRDLEKPPEERLSKKKRFSTCIHLVNVCPQGPTQEGWASLESQEDVKQALLEFRRLLAARGFAGKTELLGIHGVSATRRYARRITGIYYQIPELVSERRCYQKLLHAPTSRNGMGCDGIYIMWHPFRSRWEVTIRPTVDQPCIAFCDDPTELLVNVKKVWNVQDGLEDFREEPALAIVPPASS